MGWYDFNAQTPNCYHVLLDRTGFNSALLIYGAWGRSTTFLGRCSINDAFMDMLSIRSKADLYIVWCRQLALWSKKMLVPSYWKLTFCIVVVKQLLQAKRTILSRNVSISFHIGLQLWPLFQQLCLCPTKCDDFAGLFATSGQFR